MADSEPGCLARLGGIALMPVAPADAIGFPVVAAIAESVGGQADEMSKYFRRFEQ